MKSPPKVKKTRIAMKSPPNVSKSATTKFLRSKWRNAAGELIYPLSEEYKAWRRERKARERASCELIVKEAKERWGPEWTFSWYKVGQLLHLIFGVAIDQMRETRRSFNLAGMVLLKPKVIKECKDRTMKNPATGRPCWITWKPARSSVKVKPLKSLTRMAMLRDPHFLKRAEERHGKI